MTSTTVSHTHAVANGARRRPGLHIGLGNHHDRQVHHGELLVGADGHRSIVRRAVAPDRPDAAYAGYVIWLGIADAIELGTVRRWPAGLDSAPMALALA